MATAISVHDLTRRFGSLVAVDNISFAIEPGQVVGFVGANGAGKTTTMRVLATLEYPTDGQVLIDGVDVVQHPTEVRRKLGWMPDSFGTYEHMTIAEYLDFYARAMGFRGAERVERVRDVMDFTDLKPIAGRLINKLSKGMGQRLCLGRALVHDPEVLIMDEPAAGLDPRARVELKQLIRILAEEGKTVFISSHILSELQEMCDSLLFIHEGRLIHQGTADSLLEQAGGRTVVDVQLVCEPRKLEEFAAITPYVTFLDEKSTGGRIEIEDASDDRIADVLRRMISAGLPVIGFHREQVRLEDAFIDILGREENRQTDGASAPPPLPDVTNAETSASKGQAKTKETR